MGRMPRHFGYASQPQNSPAFLPVRATLMIIGFLQCGQLGVTGLIAGFGATGLAATFRAAPFGLAGFLLADATGGGASISGASDSRLLRGVRIEATSFLKKPEALPVALTRLFRGDIFCTP
jgi:hypothetical protein